MTDLERVLQYAQADSGRYYPLVKEIIDAHLQEDAAREADRDRERGLWTSWERRYRETEAELTELREAVRRVVEYSGLFAPAGVLDELEQLLEEKP